VSYARVLVEIGVVAPALLNRAALPLGVMAAVAIVAARLVWIRTPQNGNQIPEPENPTHLASALVFAAVFAAILLAVAAAKEHLGTGGMYAVSALAGLVNLDAITISNARIGEQDAAAADAAWRSIVIAVMANQTFKLGVIAVLGVRPLFWRALLVFGSQFAAGVLIVLFWPQ
jgi:uncharacterized membrane protein (DUF4010 family)